MEESNEAARYLGYCETCSDLLDCKEDFYLPEANVLCIDVDAKVINKPVEKCDKKEQKDKRRSFVNKLKKYISALRNTAGGTVLVHIQGLASEDKCLDHFHEVVDVKLNDMIEDGSLFVQIYQKGWLVDKDSNIEDSSRFQGFVVIHVSGSCIVTTFNFKSKQALDNCVIDVQSNGAVQFLKRPNCFEDKHASVRGIPQINERRNIQLKRFDTSKEPLLESVQQFNNFLWQDCKLAEYISAFSKIDGGGSFFLGINEDDISYIAYTSKAFSTAGIRFRDLNFCQETKAAIFQSLQDKTVIVTYSGERLETPCNTIEVAFHPVEDKFVLEVAVAAVDGLLCYDREGPEAYEFENNNLRRLTITEWYERPMTMLATGVLLQNERISGILLSEKDSNQCLDEDVGDLPSGRVDISSLYQKRPPCKQKEGSLENIEATVLQEDCVSRPMTMLATGVLLQNERISGILLSEKDSNQCLDEDVRDLPSGRVDISSLYQKRPPCKQKERSLENIEATVLQGDPKTIKIFPKSFPEGEAYANLKTRLNELSAVDNIGLAYIAKSLPVSANMDIKYKTPGEVIMDICLIRQRSPTVVLSVVKDVSDNMKLNQRYNSAVSKELTKNVRKFTTVTFNSVYGLVHEKELMSKESFKLTLERIEKERSRLCIPDSLSMNNEKYRHVVRAFLSSVAATEFVSDENDETLWFLTHKQFCIMTENIDQNEVHVDTFPASGGRVLSLTVSQRLQNLGRTLLISDDLKLIERARNHNMECKNFSELGETDLVAEGFLYIVIYESGEISSSEVLPIPQLFAAAQKRWVFHRKKGSLEEDVKQSKHSLTRSTTATSTSLDYGKCSSILGREIRMVLVGKTGAGKSATGNTICGAGKARRIFEAFLNAVAVTKKCKQHSFKRFGFDLQVVDAPGFCDTGRSEEDIHKEVMKCVGMSSPGIHAILFIMRIGRFTQEDKHTLETFLQCFGKEAKKFVIVVFTGKDDLEEDTIENYLKDKPTILTQFLFETSHRVIAVNNRGSHEEKEKFTKDLINKVKRMVDENGGQCYTDEMYKKHEAELREV